jgi:hypothetical protein
VNRLVNYTDRKVIGVSGRVSDRSLDLDHARMRQPSYSTPGAVDAGLEQLLAVEVLHRLQYLAQVNSQMRCKSGQVTKRTRGPPSNCDLVDSPEYEQADRISPFNIGTRQSHRAASREAR